MEHPGNMRLAGFDVWWRGVTAFAGSRRQLPIEECNSQNQKWRFGRILTRAGEPKMEISGGAAVRRPGQLRVPNAADLRPISHRPEQDLPYPRRDGFLS